MQQSTQSTFQMNVLTYRAQKNPLPRQFDLRIEFNTLLFYRNFPTFKKAGRKKS